MFLTHKTLITQADEPMILEHALLIVKPGHFAAFESAMARAAPLIAASPGFLGLEVRPAVERAGTYLLLVRWESVADHDPGFRRSDRYLRWKELLHGFYEPFPEVLHFSEPLPL
jgi:heme-degrading monooxygenase HmoA